MGNGNCDVCGPYDENNFESHKQSPVHVFNFTLKVFKKYRKPLVQDQHGFFITCSLLGCEEKTSYNAAKGCFIVNITADRFQERMSTLQFSLDVQNQSGYNSDLMSNLLHPHSYFHMNNLDGLNIVALDNGSTISKTVTFCQRDVDVGSFKMPIKFTINPHKPKENKESDFDIFREIVIYISQEVTDEGPITNPFQCGQWSNIQLVVPAIKAPKITANYVIPDGLDKILRHGLKSWLSATRIEEYNRRNVENILKTGLTEENYRHFFHYLLWLDETGASMGLMQYNMADVTIEVNGNDLLLEVPGLAEKRPSVVVGDLIQIRLHNDHRCFSGVISSVTSETIVVKNVHKEFVRIITVYPKIEIDISFLLSRLQYERMHRGVDDCSDKMLILFPKDRINNITIPRLSYDLLFQKDSIINNMEQRSAVEHILAGSSGRAPYIIFGPPGTGKTVTIVEAILQLKRKYPKRKILVCAPSNRACDMLTIKLAKFCKTNELIRVQSTNSRPEESIDETVRSYSNMIDDVFTFVKAEDLLKYNVVVSTLHLIGKFRDSYKAHHLFIDEAAQTTEPESCIPIGMLSGDMQVVLAGDPKQLGSVVSSTVASRYGLSVSMMERLMNKNDSYQPLQTRPALRYDHQYLTMLVQNYRSDQHIITIPNELFYNNSLEARSRDDELCRFFISARVCKSNRKISTMNGCSVEFCAVSSKEQKTGSSPSYFNLIELQMVLKYVRCLLFHCSDVCEVSTADIGIITPYIRQVHKIRQALENANLHGIEVGTTESFQGSEKRVIIISTVRAQHSLLKYDAKYKLGFVNDQRRFNVAITRAQSKLIIIGNPTVLATDRKCWGTLIEYAQDLNAFFGVHYTPRNDAVRKDILNRIGYNQRYAV